MEHPLVSIIIPAYNAAPYIKEAVDAALAQTYPHTEVIVVDDGSTDGTKRLLEAYIHENTLRYVYQENNGLAGARNTGIREAKGDYITFCDSDDIMLPEKVAHQLAALQARPEYGICYSDLFHFTDPEPRQFYHHRYQYPSGDILEPLLHRQFINPLTVFARREVFDHYGMFDASFRRSEDWELWLRFAHRGVKFLYLDEPLAHYRVRTVGNLSSAESEPAMKEKNLEFFRTFAASLSPEEYVRYNMEGILKHLRRKIALAYLIVGDTAKARVWAKEFPVLHFMIGIVPGFLWRIASRAALVLKHRFLLKKL